MLADVYKAGVLGATLERFEDRVEFRYVEGYRGEPVAFTLPVTTTPVVAPARQLPPFFVGLLPEGRRLTALRRTLKVSADDELSLLLGVGGDTVGDVQVVVHGEAPVRPEARVVDRPWGEIDLTDLFEQSVSAESPDLLDRVGVPGVQPKLSGRVSGRMISFPQKTSTGDVIVKLDPPEYPRVTVNEHLMLSAAKETGLYEVPHHELVAGADGEPALVVDRFDRVLVDGGPVALPVEDGCQALGRYPADKYDRDTIEVIAGLADRCSAPPVATLELLRRFLLSYLACDGDLHARNLAIYRDTNGLWRPTPVFDLVSTCPYGDMTLAAPFGGNERVTELGRRRFLDAADHLGIPRKAVEAMLDKTVAAVMLHVPSAVKRFVVKSHTSGEKAVRVIERRADLLTTR
ncbi:MAG: HipA domain-containing protein [Actinomycetota bacterium]|nr:HipA domain-containing protein [Actinomycetota bacterium]